MENASNNYRMLTGIKNKTKIANVLFDELTQDSACAFTPTDSTVSALTVDVCPLMINTSVCQFQLESSWLADEMTKAENDAIS